MGAVIWIVFVLALAAAALCVRVAYIGTPFAKLSTKTIASLGFIVVGILCACVEPLGSGRVYYAALMLPGLFFGLIGDVALAYEAILPQKKEQCFLVGLCAFFVGHIFYSILFCCLPQQGALFLLIAALLFLLLLCLKQFFRVQVPNRLRLPFYLYAGILCLMTGLASGAAVGMGGLLGWMVCIAAWLFLFSDVILALQYFGSIKGKWLTAAILSSYYLAQLLLAMSIWLR